ncbi:MAG: FAD-dependent oxidoreductase [Gemmatimonadota bacterium]
MSSRPFVAIIGAGPTGLGAATRMEELGHTDWALFDTCPEAGGLASSYVDDQGFTWDIGGHVLFSHYRYFDALMDRALGDAWVEHVREAWVWMRDRWIPYPFQNNIRRLPTDDLLACLDGLIDLQTAPRERPASFDQWLLNQFGQGLCDVFMFPYNFKVWAYPPATMDVGWMGERVAPVDLKRVVRNVVRGGDDVGWGPNSTFRFPLHGGTGAIWRSVAEQLPRERMRLGRRVVSVDLHARRLTLADGEQVAYDHLISTMPLDLLLGILKGGEHLAPQAPRFVHSSSHIVGVGFDGPVPDELRTKCWMYFPESTSPFYRVTVFSNYSPHNVPRPGEQWSLMAEVSESSAKPVDHARVIEDVIDGFRASRLIRDDERIVSTWHRRMEHGYPTPWLGRDDVLAPIDAELSAHGILSRGRFGAWKYEVSNQDHSVMQGVEAVGRILEGTPEYTFHGDMRDWLDPVEPAGSAGGR